MLRADDVARQRIATDLAEAVDDSVSGSAGRNHAPPIWEFFQNRRGA